MERHWDCVPYSYELAEFVLCHDCYHQGALLSRAQYGKGTKGRDYSPVTCQPSLCSVSIHCGCCMQLYPCCLPTANHDGKRKPKVLSTAGMSKDAKKVKCSWPICGAPAMHIQ